jgi:hypothetical protein
MDPLFLIVNRFNNLKIVLHQKQELILFISLHYRSKSYFQVISKGIFLKENNRQRTLLIQA